MNLLLSIVEVHDHTIITLIKTTHGLSLYDGPPFSFRRCGLCVDRLRFEDVSHSSSSDPSS